MPTKLSEAEKRVISLWLSTDTGDTLLKIIDETKQNYLDEAMAAINKGPQFTHDRVVAAKAVEELYEWLKTYRKVAEKEEED